MDILSRPGVMEEAERDTDVLGAEAMQLFSRALEEMIAMRAREGEELQSLIEQRIAGIGEIVEKVRPLIWNLMLWHIN